ncbi:MAG: hypothetical protein Q7U12_08130 [Undibacterium sp.]|nr:hypothetical protein [Undibacterium sp.]
MRLAGQIGLKGAWVLRGGGGWFYFPRPLAGEGLRVRVLELLSSLQFELPTVVAVRLQANGRPAATYLFCFAKKM